LALILALILARVKELDIISLEGYFNFGNYLSVKKQEGRPADGSSAFERVRKFRSASSSAKFLTWATVL
jgi:hypothetical protein